MFRSGALPESACPDLVAICFQVSGLRRLFAPGVSRLFLWRAAMPQGTIKRLLSDRGFGFIRGDQGELFFHRSEVQGVAFEELHEGQKVEYEIGQGKKGPCATSVRVV